MKTSSTLTEIDRLLQIRRQELIKQAPLVYAQLHSLRRTAAILGVSHGTVRNLLREAARKAE